jgi:hypothetical protein
LNRTTFLVSIRVEAGGGARGPRNQKRLSNQLGWQQKRTTIFNKLIVNCSIRRWANDSARFK